MVRVMVPVRDIDGLMAVTAELAGLKSERPSLLESLRATEIRLAEVDHRITELTAILQAVLSQPPAPATPAEDEPPVAESTEPANSRADRILVALLDGPSSAEDIAERIGADPGRVYQSLMDLKRKHEPALVAGPNEKVWTLTQAGKARALRIAKDAKP